MTTPITCLFASHEDARQAASRLEQAGIPRGQVSLLDQHSDGHGGTLLTVLVSEEQAGVVSDLLPSAVPAAGDAPLTDTAALHDAAPAYVAGGTANLGTPGPR